jgi:hypothetical protein
MTSHDWARFPLDGSGKSGPGGRTPRSGIPAPAVPLCRRPAAVAVHIYTERLQRRCENYCHSSIIKAELGVMLFDVNN